MWLQAMDSQALKRLGTLWWEPDEKPIHFWEEGKRLTAPAYPLPPTPMQLNKKGMSSILLGEMSKNILYLPPY